MLIPECKEQFNANILLVRETREHRSWLHQFGPLVTELMATVNRLVILASSDNFDVTLTDIRQLAPIHHTKEISAIGPEMDADEIYKGLQGGDGFFVRSFDTPGMNRVDWFEKGPVAEAIRTRVARGAPYIGLNEGAEIAGSQLLGLLPLEINQLGSQSPMKLLLNDGTALAVKTQKNGEHDIKVHGTGATLFARPPAKSLYEAMFPPKSTDTVTNLSNGGAFSIPFPLSALGQGADLMKLQNEPHLVEAARLIPAMCLNPGNVLTPEQLRIRHLAIFRKLPDQITGLSKLPRAKELLERYLDNKI